jgi:hypothetical protein
MDRNEYMFYLKALVKQQSISYRRRAATTLEATSLWLQSFASEQCSKQLLDLQHQSENLETDESIDFYKARYTFKTDWEMWSSESRL